MTWDKKKTKELKKALAKKPDITVEELKRQEEEGETVEEYLFRQREFANDSLGRPFESLVDEPCDECECEVCEADILDEEDETEGGTYQLVDIDGMLDVENEALFRSVDPKEIELAEAARLIQMAGELVRAAVSGTRGVSVKQMRHWQRISRGEFPWGWKIEQPIQEE